jgi:hypothetical protein
MEVQMVLQTAQALSRKKFPARRVPHSQTFLAVVYGKMVLFDPPEVSGGSR